MYKVPNPDQVQTLLTQAKQGDVKAFGRLYDLFVNHIYRYVVTRVRNSADAQDITSEVFKKAWEYLYRFHATNFRALLYTIARNLVVDHVRKSTHSVSSLEATTIVDTSQDVEKKLEKKEAIQALQAALDHLPESYKEVIMCRFIDDLSIKETAHVLKKSSISVRVLQFKAIRRLKQLLT